MMRKRIDRMIEKNWNDVRGILLREYPDFVLSNRVTYLVGIPVFVFHDVTEDMLEPMLQFLTANGYSTLTADEYVERQIRGQRGREREVLLTFDDGHKSLFSVVYPMLKRYGLKAVAYIVPGLTPEANGSNIANRSGSFCSWNEVEEMHRSGCLDIQSHSMYHHSISISERLIDFVQPNMKLSFLDSDLAPKSQWGSSTGTHGIGFGTPIYEWGSRFGANRAYRENPLVSIACRAYVEDHGGAEYFNAPGWRRRLKRVWEEARRKEPNGEYETDEEQRKCILSDLLESKGELERRLPGKIVRHFCFPWFRGSQLSLAVSGHAGYISNAWASILPTFVRKVHEPLPIARLSPSYLWRLPGKGRKSIQEVLRQRVSRFRRRLFADV